MAVSISNLFNAQWYLAKNPDVAAAVRENLITAFDHFLQYGASEDRSPLPFFNVDDYLKHNPDVAEAAANGLISAVEHFLLYGQSEPRLITPFIDLGAYLRANPDVAAAGIAPMQHLLQYGAAEGRSLGNGIDLRVFANDPQFTAAIESGDFETALVRVQEVAPFLPAFQAPDGWTPAGHTPIPVDFVPAEGVKLAIPEGVIVPPDVKLPEDLFEPVKAGTGPVSAPVPGPGAGPGPGPGPQPGDGTDADATDSGTSPNAAGVSMIELSIAEAKALADANEYTYTIRDTIANAHLMNFSNYFRTSPIGITLTGSDGDQWVTGSVFADYIEGGAGDDWLFGGAGDDSLFGGEGHDAVYGGDGNDQLIGGAGNEQISGGAGDDLLFGGAGSDMMLGGAGNDTFVYTSVSESLAPAANDSKFTIDYIADFSSGKDRLDISALNTSLTGGGAASTITVTTFKLADLVPKGGDVDSFKELAAALRPKLTASGENGLQAYIIDLLVSEGALGLNTFLLVNNNDEVMDNNDLFISLNWRSPPVASDFIL